MLHLKGFILPIKAIYSSSSANSVLPFVWSSGGERVDFQLISPISASYHGHNAGVVAGPVVAEQVWSSS